MSTVYFWVPCYEVNQKISVPLNRMLAYQRFTFIQCFPFEFPDERGHTMSVP